MIIKVMCKECCGAFQTNIPKEAMDDYQNGMPVDIAFYHVSENAKNLVVDKLCPTCFSEQSNDE